MLPVIVPALAVAGIAYLLFKEEKQDNENGRELNENAGGKRSGGGDNATDFERTKQEGLTPDPEPVKASEAPISGAIETETDLNESET